MTGVHHVWINGLTGRMGQEIRQLIKQAPQRWKLLGGTALGQLSDYQGGHEDDSWNRLSQCLTACELLIDFSAAPANRELYKALKDLPLKGLAILIGTTGLDSADTRLWTDLAKSRDLRLLRAPNTSLGVLLTLKIAQLTGQVLGPLGFDMEVFESHHRAKLDAPSGTAKFLAEGVAAVTGKQTIYGREGLRKANEIGVASLRGGTVFGEHEIRYLGDHEELTISHRALNRTLFAEGALHLASWLLQQKPGQYRLEDIGIEDMVALLQPKA